MNNFCTRLIVPQTKSFFKSNRAMKLTCALLVAASMGVYATGNAQSARVNIQANNVTTEKVLSAIEKQTDYLFVYNKNEVDLKRKTTINAVNKTTAEVLSSMFEGTDIVYAIEGENILLMKKNNRPNALLSVNQQSNIVRGTVVDPTGVPVIGANILVKGTTNGTITDMDGNFSLEVEKGQTLVVSYIGFSNYEVKISSQKSLSITLKEDAEALDEVVVVGYTTQKKGLLTGAVSTMKVDEDMKNLPTTSVGNLLSGKLAGVNVGTPSGIPGSNPTISIRTGSSWNAQEVTYVIDGVIRDSEDFNSLSPNEIENITVLKDAAAAAVYGSRSAGGVIVVSTKRGNIGKPTIEYSYGYSVDTRTKNVDLTNAVQTGELYNRVNPNTDPAGWKWSQEELDYIATVNDGWGYDQLDAIWKNPVTQTHNLSVSGGNEKIKYFTGASYVKQNGFMDPLTYDKFNFRMNVTADITKDFKLFTGFALYDDKTGNIADGEGPNETYKKLRVWQVDQPVFTESGKLVDYGWVGNVGARVNGASGYNKSQWIKPQLTVKGTYTAPFLEGLSASVSFSKSWSNKMNEIYNTNYDMMVMKKTGQHNHIFSLKDEDILYVRHSNWTSKDKIEKSSKWSHDVQLNFQINYDHIFNEKHHVTAALVSEWYEACGAGVYGARETFPIYQTDQFWAASDSRSDTWGGGDTSWKNGRMSYIGQFGYTYDNKYLFNLSFREDGSMNFAPDQRWGLFPAGSIGWVISEEKFFNQKYIDFLKFRASAGLTGNDAVGGWQWQQSYKSGRPAYFGMNPSKVVGLTYGKVVNPNLTWEKSLTFDVGADMHFLNNWNFSFDYWYRNSYDILGNRQNTLPTTFSQSMPAENYGEIHAQGIEMELGYNGKSNDFTFHGNLTLAYGWNEVIKKDYAENAQWVDIPVGKSTSYISGYEFDQILKTQEQLDAFNKAHPNYNHGGLKPELGMMVYKDLSGPNGTPDGQIDSWDRTVLHSNNFPVVLGLNLGGSWKGLSLDMMFSGNLGIKKSFAEVNNPVEWNRAWSEWYDNSWTPENPDADLPKQYSFNVPKTYKDYSDFWIANGSFMRMKYLTLSYDLPKNQFYNKLFENVRLYFTGTNLFVLSKFNKYYDPESGANSIPVSRSFNFGVNVRF